jgi:hypothetical protein
VTQNVTEPREVASRSKILYPCLQNTASKSDTSEFGTFTTVRSKENCIRHYSLGGENGNDQFLGSVCTVRRN